MTLLTRKVLRGYYPNINPRTNIEQCQKKGIPDDVIQKLQRMQGAHTNGQEYWPVFAFSILAANLSGVDHHTTNIYATGMLLLRILYNGIYINGTTDVVSAIRSFVWLGGMVGSFTLVVKSANILYATGI
ncbi:hypothetical protein FRB93_004026 [Tulasnella sp. JGI-2019a]|nr:hypothetical protein FRB93_004026 [Tulasnella sp. JGI-2019a]